MLNLANLSIGGAFLGPFHLFWLNMSASTFSPGTSILAGAFTARLNMSIVFWPWRRYVQITADLLAPPREASLPVFGHSGGMEVIYTRMAGEVL
jgi:hypothetical protein